MIAGGFRAKPRSAVDSKNLPILERSRNLHPCADCFLFVTRKPSHPSGATIMSRKLTDRGRADARRVAKALAARHFLPDVLIHSGAARAKETAEIFAAAWRNEVELQEQARLYDASLTRSSTARARSAMKTSASDWSGTILDLVNWRRRWPARARSPKCAAWRNFQQAPSRSSISPFSAGRRLRAMLRCWRFT